MSIEDLIRSEDSVRVTKENAKFRVRDVVHVLRSNWDEWEASAQEDAQREQDADAYEHTMNSNIEVVLAGMIFDRCWQCKDKGAVDSGGIREDGDWIEVPCPSCTEPVERAQD